MNGTCARIRWTALGILGAAAAAGAGCAPEIPEAPTYFEDVRPILIANCVRCHGSHLSAVPYTQVGGVWSVDGWDPVACSTAFCDVTAPGTVFEGGLRELIVRRASEEGSMPPSDPDTLDAWTIAFSPGALPDVQREILRRWRAAGYPEGTPPPGFPAKTACEIPPPPCAAPEVPPAVVSRSPEDGETDVLRNVAVWVTFDTDLDPATIESPATGLWAEAGAGPVAAAVTWSPGELRATLVPAAPLPAGAAVTVHLETTIASATGIAFAAPESWSFTTGATLDTTPPVFGGIESAADNGNGTATLGWSAATDDTTPASAITYVVYDAADLASPVGSVVGATAFTTPSLPPGSYAWTVRARDSAGNEDANSASAGATITIPAVSFGGDVLPLLNPTCTGVMCHDAMAPQRGLNLTASAAYGELVDVPSMDIPSMDRVEPGDPARSYMYLKLAGDPSIIGTQMPGGMMPSFTAASAPASVELTSPATTTRSGRSSTKACSRPSSARAVCAPCDPEPTWSSMCGRGNGSSAKKASLSSRS